MRVEGFLADAASKWPDKAALVCGGERWSYARVDDASSGLACALAARGCRRGDRVVICLDNSINAVVSIFAVLKAGCTFVIVNSQAKPDYLATVLGDSGARVLIARAPHIRSLRPSRIPLPFLRSAIDVGSGFPALLQTTGTFDRPSSDNDVAALVYTSGSTGEPKGVMLTHRNMTAAAASICAYLENTPDDVILNAMPLAFTYGLGQLTTAFRVGATLVLERSFLYPRAVLDTMTREGVTGFPLVPTMAALLLRQDLGPNPVPSLRYITNAAAALPAATLNRLRATFPNASLYSMYGQTECQRVSYLPPDQLDARPDSVGVAIPGTSVRIVDDAGAPVAAGAIGELVVRGPHVMAGYWNRPHATRRALQMSSASGEPELHTGDLFQADAAGYLYFVERTDDIIMCGGEKVAPRHVERVIAELEEVGEVAVFGMPDDVLGETVAVVITPAEGVTPTRERIQRHCRHRLEPHQMPKIVHIRDRLPTTLTGKVSRRMLKAAALAEQWPA